MPKREAKANPRFAKQPAAAAILKLLRSTRGAIIAEAPGLQPHAVRSILTRLGSKAGLEPTRTKVEGWGGLLYRAPANRARADNPKNR